MNKKKKILLVEDEKDLKFLLKQTLVEEGYEVDEAMDGEEAFEKLKENEKPDLILLDLLLPGMDGYEFLSKIKKEHDYGSIPIVVVSNLGQEREIKKAMDLGAAGYLIKANFTLSEILEKIKSFE